MSRGQPDYGQYAPKSTTGSMSDLGELASRLNSIVTYDKRGEVVELDDFESPLLNWQKAVDSASSYCRHTSDYVKRGSQSVLLHVWNGAAAYALIFRQTHILNSNRLGIEISFSYSSTTMGLVFQFSPATNDKRYYFIIKIDTSDKAVYAKNSSNVYELIATAHSLEDAIYVFHNIKFVIDLENEKYVRLLLNNIEYDISAISPYYLPELTLRDIFIQLQITPKAAIGGDVRMDNYILTQEEP